MKKSRAIYEMSFAVMTWGCGFLALHWGIGALTPFWLNTARFSVATLALGTFFLIRGNLGSLKKKELILSAVGPGVFISGSLLLQTWGLKTIPVSESALITSLYVVEIPIAQALLKRRFPPMIDILSAPLAVLSIFLVSGWDPNIQGSFIWEFGHTLTLLCSLSQAIQILIVGKVSEKKYDPAAFHFWQIFWATWTCLIAALVFEPHPLVSQISSWDFKIWGSLFHLGILSTVIGFMIQIRAQAVLSELQASLMFLLEAPIASILAMTFLSEHFSPLQWAGGLLLLVACVVQLNWGKKFA